MGENGVQRKCLGFYRSKGDLLRANRVEIGKEGVASLGGESGTRKEKMC